MEPKTRKAAKQQTRISLTAGLKELPTAAMLFGTWTRTGNGLAYVDCLTQATKRTGFPAVVRG